jgi:hypothetical protein
MNGAVPPQMESTVNEAESRGMELLGWVGGGSHRSNKQGEAPSWIELPEKFGLSGSRGEYIKITGDTYVYWAISNGSNVALVYSQLKSDYYETTPSEGTCPNCQKYVKRMEDNDYLTCHRCGWQYKPMSERLRNLF